jgi:WXG100 family type VII secretion target
MAERILVSTEEMRNTVSTYESNKSKQQTAYLQMSNAVRTLDGFWDGPASEVFKGAFNALYKNLETSEQRMQDAIDELKKSADLYDQTNDDISGKMGQLEAGSSYS